MNYGQVSQGEEKGSPVQPQKQWILFVLLMKGGRMKDIIFMWRNYFRHSVYNLQEIISHCIQKHKNQRESRRARVHGVPIPGSGGPQPPGSDAS